MFAFYDARLRPLAWVPARYRGQRSTEVEVAYWQRDDMLLEIAILYNDQPDARLPAGATDYATAYTLELMYYGLPLPSPAP